MSRKWKVPAKGLLHRRPRLVLMLSADWIWVVELRSTLRGVRPVRCLSRPLARAEESEWPDLTAAMQEVREWLGTGGARVSVSLLPPLAQTKTLTLPAVRSRELYPLVLRNARRYFLLGETGPVVVDAWRPPGRRGQGTPPTLAVCATDRVLNALTAAIQEVGFRLEAVTPGSVSLLRAVLGRVTLKRSSRIAIVIRARAWGEVIFLESGQPRLFLPFPVLGEGSDAEQLAEIEKALRRAGEQGVQPTHLVACATPALAEALRTRCENPEARLPSYLSIPDLEGLTPQVLTALGACWGTEDAPLLRRDRERAVARHRARLRAAGVCALTTAVLAVAAGAHLWKLQRSLELLQERRQMIAPAVVEVRAARRQIDAVQGVLGTLAQLEAEAPRWTRELTELANTLPPSAYLEQLRFEKGKLRLTGVAESASDLVPVLEASPRFAQVGLDAPVRRNANAERESFDIVLELGASAVGAAEQGKEADS